MNTFNFHKSHKILSEIRYGSKVYHETESTSIDQSKSLSKEGKD